MIIVKKSGNKEPFYEYKVRTSIENCANDINFPMNQADINVIVNAVVMELRPFEDCELTSSKVRAVLFVKLKELRFTKMANEYINFNTK